MDLIRDIEESDDELIIREAEGSGPVLFYTGLTGIVSGVVFAVFDAMLGQIVVILSAVVVIAGYILAKRQTSLEIHHDEDLLTTEDSRWQLSDAVAVVIAPRRRVPDHIDDPSLVTDETGMRLWRAWLFASDDIAERNRMLEDLESLLDEADQLHVLELDERLADIGGDVFMQMPNPENPGDAAARAARHLSVPFFDFALAAAPRKLAPEDVSSEELDEIASA